MNLKNVIQYKLRTTYTHLHFQNWSSTGRYIVNRPHWPYGLMRGGIIILLRLVIYMGKYRREIQSRRQKAVYFPCEGEKNSANFRQ